MHSPGLAGGMWQPGAKPPPLQKWRKQEHLPLHQSSNQGEDERGGRALQRHCPWGWTWIQMIQQSRERHQCDPRQFFQFASR